MMARAARNGGQGARFGSDQRELPRTVAVRIVGVAKGVVVAGRHEQNIAPNTGSSQQVNSTDRRVFVNHQAARERGR